MNSKISKKSIVKKVVSILTVVSLSCSLFAFTGCSTSSDTTASTTKATKATSRTRKKISESTAVSKVKDYWGIEDKIASKFGLVHYYSPDWGTSEVEYRWSDDRYRVTIYGNISGYTDNYKTKFSYDNKFEINAIVDAYTGEVSSVYVYSK